MIPVGEIRQETPRRATLSLSAKGREEGREEGREGGLTRSAPLYELTRGVTTPTRPVSGEQQNFSGNMEIFPGIGRLEKISGKHEIISGHCMKKAGQDTT